MTASNNPGPWSEPYTCAVALAYDGAAMCHTETVARCLGELGLPATFYCPCAKVLESVLAWRKLSEFGHEIGAAIDGGLEGYSPEMVREELYLEKSGLNEIFGETGRSFGFPLPDPSRHDKAMAQSALIRASVADLFHVARSSTDGLNDPKRCDLLRLRTVRPLDRNASELIQMVELARSKGNWIIVSFEGVGVGDPAMDAIEHAKFCLWLAENRSTIYVATVHAIGARIEASRLSGKAVVGDPFRRKIKAQGPSV